MTSPGIEQVLRRMIGAAFDAGVQSSPRSAGDRARERSNHIAYVASVLERAIETEVSRRLTAQDGAP